MTISDREESIPEQAIEAFARSFFKEASAYGFGQLDYLRFVNQLLDFSINKTDLPGNNVDRGGGRRQQKSVNTINDQALRALPINGEQISVRALQSSGDRELVKSWLSDRHGRHFLLSRTTSRTVDFDDLVYIPSSIFGIIILRDGTPIGSVAFLDHDPLQHKAELRKLIGEPRMRGKGLAKEATRLWIQYGIDVLGLKKIYLNTLNTNIRNIKLNKELGFKFEGILRNEVFLDGEYHDVLRMGMWKQ